MPKHKQTTLTGYRYRDASGNEQYEKCSSANQQETLKRLQAEGAKKICPQFSRLRTKAGH